MDDNLKEELIRYCEYIYDNYAPLDKIDSKPFLKPIYLELLFTCCKNKLQFENKYEIDGIDLHEINDLVFLSEESFQKTLNKEIDIIAIQEDDTLMFNLDPTPKPKSRRKKKKENE